MTRFNKILSESIAKMQFKRVRLKSDPVNPESIYEGYIIEEMDNGDFKVFVLSQDSPDMGNIITVGPDQVESEVETCCSNFCKFKAFVVDYLDYSCECGIEREQIENINSLEFLEVYLKQAGYSDECLLNLYRDFINA